MKNISWTLFLCASLTACGDSSSTKIVNADASASVVPAENVEFLQGLALVEQWNELGLAAVREGKADPTIIARQLFMLSAAIYDAYAIYDDVAIPYALDAASRQPVEQHTLDNQSEAVSQAAYQMLSMTYPDYEAENGYFLQHLRALGYSAVSEVSAKPSGQGYAAALAVVDERRDDGSNSQNNYADTVSLYYPEKYQPINRPGGVITDSNRWQPLRIPNGGTLDGLSQPVVDSLNPDSFSEQQFLTPHWGAVTPFSLSFGGEFRPQGPPKYGSDAPYVDGKGVESTSHEAYTRQAGELLEHSANLTAEQKLMAEFWANGPRSESPPGHWNQLTHGIIDRDELGVADSVKLLFTLNAALLDASIATWEAKRHYDYVRPASAIRFLYDGKLVKAWGGPGQGTQMIAGESWRPYQRLTFVTPASPGYVSLHSSFGHAAAEVLTQWTGAEIFYDGVTLTRQDINDDGKPDMLGEHVILAGSSQIEQGPAEDMDLHWHTFLEAADEAGQSTLFGGINSPDGDLRGRVLGAQVGKRAFETASKYFDGSFGK